MKFAPLDLASDFVNNIGAAMDWIAEAWHEVKPQGTSTIETLSDGETKNIRDHLQTFDLISLEPGALVTSTIEGME